MPACSVCLVHLATEADVIAHIVDAGRFTRGRPRKVQCQDATVVLDALVLPDAGEAAGAGGGLGMAGEEDDSGGGWWIEDDGPDTQVHLHGCAPAHGDCTLHLHLHTAHTHTPHTLTLSCPCQLSPPTVGGGYWGSGAGTV